MYMQSTCTCSLACNTHRIVHPEADLIPGIVQLNQALQHLWQEGGGHLNEHSQQDRGPLGAVLREGEGVLSTGKTAILLSPGSRDVVSQAVQVHLEGETQVVSSPLSSKVSHWVWMW